MGKKKDTKADTAAPAKKVTQREAVTQALAAGKELPPDGVKFVKDTFGMELSNQSFSTLKSQIKKKAGTSTPARKPGRPAGRGDRRPTYPGWVMPPACGAPRRDGPSRAGRRRRR